MRKLFRLKYLRYIFWNLIYYPIILVKVSFLKFLLGPDAFSRILENIPYSPIITKFLKRYGALIGEGAIIKTKIHIHCPQGIKKPFVNFTMGINHDP